MVVAIIKTQDEEGKTNKTLPTKLKLKEDKDSLKNQKGKKYVYY